MTREVKRGREPARDSGRSGGVPMGPIQFPAMFVRARRFPVPHGFSTREGGVSEGAFASLNLGFSVKDDPKRVEENLRRFARALEIPIDDLHSVSQVHGDTVVEARERAPAGQLSSVTGEADALFTARSGASVGVKTADCVPILLADPQTKTVAAVHSGWRGTELEITARAVETLVKRGAQASKIQVAIGPCIRSCCYEVSAELGDKFTQKFG